MAEVSSGRQSSVWMSALRIDAASVSAVAMGVVAICALVACAEVLGIPSDPEISAPVSELAPSHSEAMPRAEAMTPDGAAAPSTPVIGGTFVPGSDGIVPSGDVTGIDPVIDEGLGTVQPEARQPGGVDAGLVDAGSDAPPAAAACDGFERVPIDVAFIVDNSGSMVDEAAAFERALPAFVERLESEGVDFRIILLSRHRVEEPSASDEASTSICISAPVSGLDACPSERPVPGPRFYQYSVKIDAADSLQRALQTFSQPDPFELTQIGWSEWLRAGSRHVFIEISDADSDLSASELTVALSAAAPERFGVDPAAPSFVFHSVIGVRQKVLSLDIYGPDEAIEPRICEGEGSNPDNAGEVYQELSRLTRGLRLSICPAAALGLRLQALATDAVLRSFRSCAATPD